MHITSNEIYNFIKDKNIITDINFVDFENKDECIICLEDSSHPQLYSLLKCGHIFHDTCINKWMRKNKGICPVCRTRIYEDTILKWYIEKSVTL